jgi:transposase InsO family protein
VVLAHDRRRVIHFNVTAHPTAERTGQQLREAFPFDQFQPYLLRDRDAIFGLDFRDQVRDMGIEEVLSAPRSPWQRAYVERIRMEQKQGWGRKQVVENMVARDGIEPRPNIDSL